MDKTHDELEEDPECIGNCFLQSDKPEKVEKGYVFTYQFNDQDYKLKKDSTVYNAHQNLSLGSIIEITEDSPNKNIIKIKLTEKKYQTLGEMPSVLSLSRRGPAQIAVLEQALNRFVENYINLKGASYKCILDLLNTKNPSFIEKLNVIKHYQKKIFFLKK